MTSILSLSHTCTMQRLTHHGLSNLHLDDVLVDVVTVIIAGDAVVNVILSNVMLAMWTDTEKAVDSSTKLIENTTTEEETRSHI